VTDRNAVVRRVLSFAFVEGEVCEPDPMSLGFAGGIPVPASRPPDAF
jgi:hypothetical protein